MAKNLFDLTGKTALVTGARKGIGLAMARILAEHGADLIVVSSKQAPDDELTRYVKGLGRKITAHTFDLRYRKETKALVEAVAETPVDILINNAGIANRGEVLVHTDEQWDETLEIDLTAPFILSRDLAKGMAERGYGKIIFTASMWSYLGGKNVISYTAAKTALAGLVRGLSNELLPLGIRVNGIAPGFIETDINERVRQDKERFAFITSRIPSGKWGKPEDLAGTTLFLSAPASDYVSGVVIPVDGGYLAN
ncbi:MAG: SDR family oxidoreductase [Actinobacteria bacterium]|jgi:2-dehydro-3-deoxy-D-gluconate 5-dehydrogenase|nr:SDR family oxidoreductase [Actinomycetota bacterium]